MALSRVAFLSAVRKSLSALWHSAPLLVGVILFVGLAQAFLPPQMVGGMFHHNALLDAFVGSAAGSIMAGNPVTSYVIGGELLNQGASLTAITAFLVAWVSVGIVQFPAEAIMLGRRFSLLRNSISFLLCMIVAILTSAILQSL